MSINKAIECILENNLDNMKTNINAVITEKAVNKLEEVKKNIAKTYFASK